MIMMTRLSCNVVVLFFSLLLQTGWMINVTNGQQQSCASATNDLFDINTELNDAWSDAQSGVFDKCEGNIDPNLCTFLEFEDWEQVTSVTRFVDKRALRDTPEYETYVNECRAEGWSPIEVDMELFIENDFRLYIIKRLQCLPKGCTNNVDDLTSALLAQVGDDYITYIENTRGFDFHPLDEPVSVSNCNPSDAQYNKMSSLLYNAVVQYITRYNEECNDPPTIEETEEYCQTLYLSRGEWDAWTYNFHNNYNSIEFQTYYNECTQAGGKYCSADIIITKQFFVTDRGDLDRQDINWIFNGYPQCVHATSCTYDDTINYLEERSLNFYFRGITSPPDDNDNERRSLLVQKTQDRAKRNLLRTNTEDAAATATGTSALWSQKKKHKNYKRNKLTMMDDATVINKKKERLYNKMEFLEVDRTMLFNLANNNNKVDLRSKATREFPTHLFQEEGSQNSNNNNNDKRLLKFNEYEGERFCGDEVDRCYARLSNVCLRPYNSDTTTNTSPNNDEEEDEEEEEPSILPITPEEDENEDENNNEEEETIVEEPKVTDEDENEQEDEDEDEEAGGGFPDFNFPL